MAKKQSFVQTIRPARANEIDANDVQKFDIKVGVYSADIINELNASDKTPDAIRKIMLSHKPKNEIQHEKPKFDGFANVFDLFASNENKTEYTDVTGVPVTVVAILDSNVAMFDGTIERKNGLTVFVKVGDTYIACPTQRDCWFFM